MARATSKGGWGKCTVCAHPDREAIEAAIGSGQPIAKVAKSHGLSRSAVHRHLDRHRSRTFAVQPSQIIRATPAGDSTAAELEALLLDAKAQLQTAGSTTQTLATIEAMLKIVVARGQWLARHPSGAPINVLSTPNWMAARWVLLDVLSPFPDLRARIDDRFKRATGHPFDWNREQLAYLATLDSLPEL